MRNRYNTIDLSYSKLDILYCVNKLFLMKWRTMETKHLSIAQALKTAFKNVIDNAWLLLLKVNLIWTACGLGMFLIMLIHGSKAQINWLNPITNNISNAKAIWASLNPMTGILLLLYAYFLLTIHLGYTKIALEINDTGKSTVKTLFSCFWMGFKYLCALVLYFIMCLAGLILLILPGLYVMLRLNFFKQIMVDENAGIIESLKKSWELTRGFAGKICLLMLAIMAMSIVSNVMVIGLVFTTPFLELIMVNSYRQLQGRAESANVTMNH